MQVSSGPETAPSPTIAPNRPNTFPRSCAGKVACTIDSTCGTIIAAIPPCRMREATSISGFAAKPHSAEASGEAADADEEQPLAAVDVTEPSRR